MTWTKAFGRGSGWLLQKIVNGLALTRISPNALTFIGLPFVVRTVQPVLEDLDLEYEEAAASLGASRLQTVFRVVGPNYFPRCSRDLRSRSPGPWASTALSFSLLETCR